MRGEFLADFIGAGEIALAAGFLSLVNERLDFVIEQFFFAVAEEVQHGVETVERGQYFLAVGGAHLATRTHRGIHFAHEIMHGGQRDGGVQIVV